MQKTSTQERAEEGLDLEGIKRLYEVLRGLTCRGPGLQGLRLQGSRDSWASGSRAGGTQDSLNLAFMGPGLQWLRLRRKSRL